MSLLNLFDKLTINPEPNKGIQSKETYMFLMGGIMSIGGLVWCALCLYFEIYLGGFIPFSYIILTATNLILYKSHNNFSLASSFQVSISLLLPFMMQWYLGGFLPSGAVMMWGILAVLGSLSFHSFKTSRFWIFVFLVLTVVSCTWDLINFGGSGVLYQVVFLVVNITFIFTAIYFLVVYFIHVRDEANEVLKEQNRLIASSIDYAKVIQNAVVPTESDFLKLIPKSFLIYKPKEVVSGDFYWAKRISDNQFHLVVADCTGQGVPGAFMSLLGINILNQIAPSDYWLAPNLIFDRLDEQVSNTFATNNDSFHTIDASIISVNLEKKLLFFCGANSRMFLLRKNKEHLLVNNQKIEPFIKFEQGSLFMLKGDNRGIGDSYDADISFFRHQISFEEGDQVFLPTDGFYSHFSALSQKEQLRQKLQELMIKMVAENSAMSRKKAIEQSLKESNSKSVQIDDISIVGFEL